MITGKTVLVSMVLMLMLINTTSAASPDTVVFSDSFSTGMGQWAIGNGDFGVVDNTLYMDDVGNIYKNFTTSEMNSPNRELQFNWKPSSVYQDVTVTPFTLEQGALTATQVILTMSYSNDTVWFTSYQYYNGVVTNTSTSSAVAIDKNEWNTIKIITDTNTTEAVINGQATYLAKSNTYNWIRFSNANSSQVIVTDSGTSSGNTNLLSAGQYIWRKTFNITASPADLSGASLTFRMLTNDGTTPTGKVAVDVNGQRALNLTQTELDAPAGTDRLYTITINKALLVQGVNNVDFYGVDGTTSFALRYDGGPTNTTSYYSNDLGANYVAAPGGVEFICRLNLARNLNAYYIDNILLKKEAVFSNNDLVGRVYDVMGSATIPTNDPAEICAIYPYFLTRDPAYLARAETAANNIQNWHDQGLKSMQVTREMALLASVNSSRMDLLNDVALTEWTYYVNQSTKLPYKTIYPNGTAYDATCFISDPIDAYNVVDDFIYAYKVTGNETYLSYATQIMDATYTYMRHPTYDTIITSVNAGNGTAYGVNWNASRGCDEIMNFVETSLFLYDVSGDSKYLTNAIYQADTWGAYTYNSTLKTYTYRPDDTSLMEVFIPSHSLTLMHLYEYTGNETYLERAQTNYYNYWQINRINGLPAHQFSTTGLFWRDPLVWDDSRPVTAALLYKHTGNSTYVDIADESIQGALAWFIPQSAIQIDCEDLTVYNSVTANYQTLMWYESEMLYSFIYPSPGVNISWSLGNDFRAKYRSVTTPITDVSFTDNSVSLYNVSGNGVIRFHEGIDEVNIITQPGSCIGVDLQRDISIMPSSGSVNVSIIQWGTSGNYAKIWRESSETHTATTQHVIGGFPANSVVQIDRDGVAYDQVTSDSTGQITWTYTGGYSEHEFEAFVSEIANMKTAARGIWSDGVAFMVVVIITVLSMTIVGLLRGKKVSAANISDLAIGLMVVSLVVTVGYGVLSVMSGMI